MISADAVLMEIEANAKSIAPIVTRGEVILMCMGPSQIDGRLIQLAFSMLPELICR